MTEYIKFFAKTLYQSLVAPAGPFFLEKDYPDLNHKKWLVTGATGGIGLEIAKILAKQHAELFLVGRSSSKLDKAVEEVKKTNPDVIVHVLLIDYNDLETVKPAVAELKKLTGSLDGIIHNAGVMNVPKGAKTKQGIEQTVGVNNVATQYLQDNLDPFIVKSNNGRIVWLSSLGHLGAPYGGFNVKTIANGSPWVVYCLSKALDYIQAVQWSLRHPESNVKSIAAHPGVIKSELTRSTSQFERKVLSYLMYDTHYGALSPIYAALSPDAQNNGYIVPFGREGYVRPDIYAAARDERGEAALQWLKEKYTNFG